MGSPGSISHPTPTPPQSPVSPFLFLSPLGRAWLRRPHHLHPLLKKQPRPLQSHQHHHHHPTPAAFCCPAAPSGCWGEVGGLPRSLGEGSYWLVPCPRLGRAPGTGILRVPGQSALCISRWRGRLCLRRRPGCLADAIRIISEPRDPEPPTAAEGGQKPPRLSSRCWAPAALLDAPSTPSICRGMELMR